MKKLIENIIEKMDIQVNKYNYLPKNFMFIFPIISNNAFAKLLEIAIQQYWINKFSDEKYHIQHKLKIWILIIYLYLKILLL